MPRYRNRHTWTSKPEGVNDEWNSATASVAANERWAKYGRSQTRRNIRRRQRYAELHQIKVNVEQASELGYQDVETFLSDARGGRKHRTKKTDWSGMSK